MSIYDKIACDIGRRSDLHCEDGSILWSTFFEAFTERIKYHVQIPVYCHNAQNLLFQLRRASKVPKHEVFFTTQEQYNKWEPACYRTIGGHSDTTVVNIGRDSVLIKS
eukprot:6317862-Karenia_brevis.AAC.1